jgi:Catalytic LigB subunit of aromatic ring-opening dioxygenase
MAEIVAAVGVPHTPAFPGLVAREGPGSETGQLYAHIRSHLEAAGTDVLVMFDSDHLNTFFFDNLPALSVPTAEVATGTNDGTPGMHNRSVPLLPELGEQLLSGLTGQGYFPSRNAKLSVDHSVMVPLHFLDPGERMLLLPVYLNGFVPPLPGAARCLALGGDVRSIIEAWDSHLKVAIVASGSFSLEVGGPRIAGNAIAGVPDPEWVTHVSSRLKAGQTAELVAEATTERMQRAGNVGGELLNWIALLGAVGPRTPEVLEQQVRLGHSYAAWTWS